MPRGFLLLDVDGPLNPYAAKPSRRPDGYATFRLTDDGRWLRGREGRRRKGIRVWLNPGHGTALLRVAAEADLALVWATTWEDEANTRIGPEIGLPPLPVITFPDRDPVTGWRRDGRWKWAAVAEYTAGRPLAWFDDEFERRGAGAARAGFERDRDGAGTLLCHVDPREGLLPQHFDAVRRWAGLPASAVSGVGSA
ncbi:hypothetical protein [Allokutzneria albata]|uniref:Secreted protein n=1 Tax=Allokutzneria albata TaxID=211114 RepID=A0A1G9UTL2_ALLAB|nr:hypothetical protein [Allokutzneria albata]SDM63216.1 hypothetical protein SAMN04489726_2615 [Allokutzneria albata]